MSEIKATTFVDEDWKARVQREKEEARLKAQGKQPPAPDTVSPGTQDVPEESPGGEANPLFEALLNILATQAMFSLGFIGAPGQGQAVVNLEQAREFIEMLGLIREKTQGNLNAQENALLAETLAELQRLFTARVQQAQAQAMQRAGIDMNNLRGDAPQ
ncbi:MAG: hypothetical protein BWX80_00158 [Candidatus Hydrogenedentes bacterium ADurb.Bin101]|jgi:hypothetical protein|nr:MAG: hypothetical protein BWX80_00158 [Candidatus Hydrogenedentes bacterium ADurb.Bin101]HOC68184.1 DUF1844 domain-containing protein [Candidatus Hydrogenedentota bacterium]